MHIAIDARAYSWTGIGRYIRSLVQGIAKVDTPHKFSLLLPANQIEAAKSEFPLPAEKFSVVPVEPSYYSWREQTIFLRQLYSLKADLVHFTHFNTPLLFKRPYFVTIHDITRFIFPGQKRQHLFQQLAYEIVFRKAVRDARAIICVTEHTAQEMKHLPLRMNVQPKVIYEGVDDIFFQPVAQLDQQRARMMIGTSDPFLLYVGVWMSHKNLRRLLEAFKEVQKTHPALKLVLTGKPVPGYNNVPRYVRDLDLEKSVIFPGFVPHKLLPALYQQASCFIFPSLYEGFGLPPLEAAAVGAPVVSSNVSSIPEVMGEAAQYVNPEYTPSIVEGINRALNDSNLRHHLISSGKSRAAPFTWQRCVEQTLELYDDVTSNE